MVPSAIGFEGYEKRLEISFFNPGIFADPENRGLRALSKAQLDEILAPAECIIVASLCNDEVDSYVLSESSLFVYPYRMILKTCGTTKLMLSIPPVVNLAGMIGLTVCSVRYTRGCFMYPGAQPYSHRSFSDEVAVLDRHFAKLGLISEVHVMCDDDRRNKWHVYSACAKSDSVESRVYTLEMCMTHLDKNKASVFFKNRSSSANCGEVRPNQVLRVGGSRVG
ncbi:S-adenosylmethionine decarboxylase proenzyme-like isoform X1 [Andrographis paniculata]|uniref:S-adenosylmethionine decarboxylase proenzyme-like isoform X1 n=1 Tax=Andrographis paniculata TaxID=175694 RepID=UPI0021E79A38|nr:S-adenosylmethionine decarboxylase proenzyme-like isoform X1 [Andrographis paniculata]XP_051141515.1 S-adenosylmethionine decarboxylase proenzyme-like isoform X1 [Andrographis paniculata]XP_051141517.1 S-adenosylmethionine decarboxylase proenzyme-like isoform X1 [Andrographis paniculata]